MRATGWILVAATLALGAAAWAQDGTVGPVTATRDANFVRVAGAPTVLMWARGLANPEDLEAYQATGFNTAYILISSTAEEELARISALMSAAEERGLLVVAAITPEAVKEGEGEAMPPDPRAAAYGNAVTEVANLLAGRLRGHPGLIGWSVEAAPSHQFTWNDEGFRAYLSEWYDGSLTRLNQSWGTELTDWEQVVVAGVRDVDAQRLGGLGRASLDYAAYRQAAYADALGLWAKALTAADPGRLVFASGLYDYRSMISVPAGFSGLVLNAYPTAAEADWLHHNVHAVDIARRGNRFAAIPTFWVESNVEAPRVRSWMGEALLRGAAGLAVSSWAAVKGSEQLRAAVKGAADDAAAGGFPARPACRTAVLYEPYAGGVMRDGRGLYGYLDGVTPNSPSTLFAVSRVGTRYGQMDVLADDSIGEVDLNQYGAIIAPMAFYLTEEAQVALSNFVLRGGALVVDAGAGMYQAEGTVDTAPPVLTELLGLRHADLTDTGEVTYEGSLGELGQPGQPGVAVPLGPGEAGEQVPADLAKFADVLERFLSRPDVHKYLGAEFVGEEGPGFRVRGYGRGFSVYAPTFLYDSWNAADPYFNEFHDRILSWRHDLEVIEPEGVWPAVGACLYGDRAVGLVSPEGVGAIVDVYGAKNRLYRISRGAMRAGNPEEEERVELLFPGAALAVAEPLPIQVRTFEEGAVVTVSVVRYDASGIELRIDGSGAQASATRQGIRVAGGGPTNVQIEVEDGAYRVSRGSLHRVTVREGERGRPREATLMPNAESGALVVEASVRGALVTIEPAPEQ